MASPNPITLTISSVQLSGIGITVSGRSGTPGNLTTSLIKMRKFNAGTFSDFTDFSLTGATATTATIVATTNGGLFNEADLFLVQIVENTDYSDKIYLDFSEAYTSHTAAVKYEMPDQSGDYKLNFQTVNDEDFSTATPSQQFDLGDAPTPAASSLTLEKPYLVKYVGQKYTVTVVLNNAGGTAVDGNYQVVFDAIKQ